MTFAEDLTTTLSALGLPVSLGVSLEKASDKFIVFTPFREDDARFADDVAGYVVCEARIALYIRGEDYHPHKRQLRQALKNADFTITDTDYNFENSTGYHQYSADAQKYYESEDY
ncbi:hypothetical protein FACS1894202_13250 [Clostridia bacterium]|nr:hypothetical protein FACS1894202_13250 [Clostridia bacterium]